MSRITQLAVGSTTLVKAGPGTLYAAHVFGVNGASAILADVPNAGATGFNFSITSTIGGTNWSYTTQTYGASPAPEYLDFKGLQFSNLTVAATSNARVHVITD